MSTTPTPTRRSWGAAQPRPGWSTAHRPPTAADGALPWADDVFDAGLESFPASDPPSWSPLRVGAPAA